MGLPRLPLPLRTLSLALLLLWAPEALPQDGPARLPPREFFHGKVTSFEGRRITLEYDFSDSAHASDWTPTYPFVSPSVNGGWRVEKGALRGDGNAGYRMRAVFDDDLKVEATLSTEDAKNIGIMVLDEDKSVFNLCSLADTAFAMLDRKPPLMHHLTTFLPAGEGPGGSTEWRYIERGYEPRIGSRPVKVSVRKKGKMNEFRFAGSGRLSGADKEARVGPRLVPGFYTLGSRVIVTRVKVSGVLDAKWLRENNVEFEDRVPEDTEPPITGEEPEEKPETAAGGGGGAADWTGLVATLADVSRSKEDREKAADDLVETKERKAMRYLIDVLYRDDDETGRVVAWKAFKGLAGKDAGFKPQAPTEHRLKAMPRVWLLWYSVRDDIEKRERKKGR